jgi:phage gpG-like protein
MLSLNININSQSAAYLRKLVAMPSQVPGAIQRGLDNALDVLKDRIINKRLSGQGPYPPSQHRLGEVTGLLKATVTSRSLIRGNSVIGYIGADAPYAAVHELGKVIRAKNAPFLVFRILGKTIRTKQVTIPARKPFATEVESAASAKLIAQSVVDEVLKLP